MDVEFVRAVVPPKKYGLRCVHRERALTHALWPVDERSKRRVQAALSNAVGVVARCACRDRLRCHKRGLLRLSSYGRRRLQLFVSGSGRAKEKWVIEIGFVRADREELALLSPRLACVRVAG